MKPLAVSTACISSVRWMANCPITDSTKYPQKICACGLSFESCGSGLAWERKRKQAAVAMPEAVACESPSFTPSRYCTLSAYAVARQFRPRILYIWMVVTSVVRPWRMRSLHGPTLVALAVKGAAMDASPSCTKGGPSRGSSSSASWRARSRLGRLGRPSPRAARPSLGAFRDPSRGALLLCVRCAPVAWRSATPQCAVLSAPTSLVPSPHISVISPIDRSVCTISSFWSGATRANTRTAMRTSSSCPCA
mmetsp:Transcript_21254/g.46629  ORF Transcript_21254/g.46629 Transcript_21254/m.46629 type:complete len:250 (-) Transcript_21254:611-1360(-)